MHPDDGGSLLTAVVVLAVQALAVVGAVYAWGVCVGEAGVWGGDGQKLLPTGGERHSATTHSVPPLTRLEALTVLLEAAGLLAVAALVVAASRAALLALHEERHSQGAQLGAFMLAARGSLLPALAMVKRMAGLCNLDHASSVRWFYRAQPGAVALTQLSSLTAPVAILGRKALGLRSRIASTAACSWKCAIHCAG